MAQVLVGGGAGGVGEGIVRWLLRAGHSVAVPSRSAAKLELLRARLADTVSLANLTTTVAHAGDAHGAQELRARLERERGRFDAVVASLGGWWEGPRLTEIALETWDAVMDEMLRTHVVFARTFIPMLQSHGGGRYVGIGGGAAYLPIRGSALVSIAGAAQLMLTRALHAENDDPALEIVELVIDGPVRTRDTAQAAPGWITLDQIGPIVVDLVERGVTHDPRTSTDGPIVTLR
ncbi:MAG TPA: SDR family NAD(P)-dependent oxidoreductase [Candidatus Limnocylindria bacterium]|jgi:NAD(P)-dependent dehydrogenase (short-subunit alcohol dehydrogenase family)|nr:SDR family NAD(P)-dependent oxidoreductase [Candidatus Limnocylindria bacterium]